MFASVLPYITSTAGIAVGCFFLGVLLSQKVKDFAGSTPSSFRTSMVAVEKKAKAEVQAAISGIFAKLNPPEKP